LNANWSASSTVSFCTYQLPEKVNQEQVLSLSLRNIKTQPFIIRPIPADLGRSRTLKSQQGASKRLIFLAEILLEQSMKDGSFDQC
jgi:hypothetical protein